MEIVMSFNFHGTMPNGAIIFGHAATVEPETGDFSIAEFLNLNKVTVFNVRCEELATEAEEVTNG